MNGLILLDKPKGMTSFQAAAAIRRIYSTKRIGHTGTLDPMATGVLPILIGRATRLCSMVIDADKAYSATVKLGITTDSLDITGNVTSTKSVNVSKQQIIDACNHFLGFYHQVPPMFSALKKNGVRLYSMARQGIEIEREARLIEIKKIDAKVLSNDTFVIDVVCSKGTYIRSLADDIGTYLGTGAVLCELRRTSTAQFDISQCATLEQIETEPQRFLQKAENCVDYLSSVTVSQKQANRFLHGGELSLDRLNGASFNDEQLVKVFFNQQFLGLGVVDFETAMLKVKFIVVED